MFAPNNGMCYRCKKDIVTEKWATEHIVGCPKCNKSYCD